MDTILSIFGFGSNKKDAKPKSEVEELRDNIRAQKEKVALLESEIIKSQHMMKELEIRKAEVEVAITESRKRIKTLTATNDYQSVATLNVLVTIDLPKALMGLTTNIEEMELGIAALEEKKTAVLAETEESERLLKELIQQFQQKTGEVLSDLEEGMAGFSTVDLADSSVGASRSRVTLESSSDTDEGKGVGL